MGTSVWNEILDYLSLRKRLETINQSIPIKGIGGEFSSGLVGDLSEECCNEGRNSNIYLISWFKLSYVST